MATICKFGTAPEQKKAGYKSLGIVVQGTDEEVLKVFSQGDIRLVRGCSISNSNEHQFFPFVLDEQDF